MRRSGDRARARDRREVRQAHLDRDRAPGDPPRSQAVAKVVRQAPDRTQTVARAIPEMSVRRSIIPRSLVEALQIAR